MTLSQTKGTSRKPTRASRLVEVLRGSILNGDMTPGQKVNLDQLREAHGVSLSPMREAVSRLVNFGLMEFEDQRGYSIAPVSLDNLKEVIRLRADQESLAVGYAVERAGLDWESGVLAALHRLNRTAVPSDDPVDGDTRDAAHRAFHMALVGGSGMPMLVDFCRTLYDLNGRYRRLYASGAQQEPTMSGEHAEIADAAAVRRDRRAAETLLRAHIERTGRELISQFGEQKAGSRDRP